MEIEFLHFWKSDMPEFNRRHTFSSHRNSSASEPGKKSVSLRDRSLFLR